MGHSTRLAFPFGTGWGEIGPFRGNRPRCYPSKGGFNIPLGTEGASGHRLSVGLNSGSCGKVPPGTKILVWCLRQLPNFKGIGIPFNPVRVLPLKAKRGTRELKGNFPRPNSWVRNLGVNSAPGRGSPPIHGLWPLGSGATLFLWVGPRVGQALSRGAPFPWLGPYF